MCHNITATFCNVSHGADSCILQQRPSDADRKVRKIWTRCSRTNKLKPKGKTSRLFKVTLRSVRQNARTLPKQTRSLVRKVCSRVYLHREVWGGNKNKAVIRVVNGASLERQITAFSKLKRQTSGYNETTAMLPARTGSADSFFF